MRRILVVGPKAPLAAAALIRSLRGDGVKVAAAYAGLRDPTSDFVTADGTFLPNDVFWLEWASGRPLSGNPKLELTGDAARVVAASHRSWVAGDEFEIVSAEEVSFGLDRFGRPCGRLGSDPPAGKCRIGLIGDPDYLSRTYPAVLARLGDAAGVAGLAVAPMLMPASDAMRTELDGVILPGGREMGQVEGQVELAARALAQGIPTLGLCLGMQSMLTAAVRAAIWPDAVLEEIAGPGPYRSFVRMRSPDGSPVHRVGEEHFRPAAGTRLAELLPHGAAVRMNHRFRFNQEIREASLPELVLHWSGDVADAVEHRTHPFFIGFQGHPELGSDPALLSLWVAFVRAALEKRNAADLRWSTGGDGLD